jgi:hypothetical protein
MAQAIGSDPGRTQTWLFSKFRDFRQELFEEGRGRVQGAPSAYTKTSGFELEKENQQANSRGVSWTSAYSVSKKKFSPDEEGEDPETGFREAQPEKYKRELPIAGNYASIPSIIGTHTLDGAIDKFAAFLVTGKIKTPEISIAGLLGITMDDTDNEFKRSSAAKGKTSGNWLF